MLDKILPLQQHTEQSIVQFTGPARLGTWNRFAVVSVLCPGLLVQRDEEFLLDSINKTADD